MSYYDSESEAAADRETRNQRTLLNPDNNQPVKAEVAWIFYSTAYSKWVTASLRLQDNGEINGGVPDGYAYLYDDYSTIDQGGEPCPPRLANLCQLTSGSSGACDPSDIQDRAEAMLDSHYVYVYTPDQCQIVANQEACTDTSEEFCLGFNECPSDTSGGGCRYYS